MDVDDEDDSDDSSASGYVVEPDSARAKEIMDALEDDDDDEQEGVDVIRVVTLETDFAEEDMPVEPCAFAARASKVPEDPSGDEWGVLAEPPKPKAKPKQKPQKPKAAARGAAALGAAASSRAAPPGRMGPVDAAARLETFMMEHLDEFEELGADEEDDQDEPPAVTFGKYKGKTARDLVTTETQYVLWAKTQEKPSPCLQEMLEWIDRYYSTR